MLLLRYLLPFLTHPARLRLIHLYNTVNTTLIITFIIHKNNDVDTYIKIPRETLGKEL